jgi:ribonucleotide reductase beta subunit family protein with ferritin-like domain
MALRVVADVTYEDLYRRWEAGNWRATEIDFSADRAGWESLNEIQHKSMRWQFAMFFNGEDSVADNLSPYIDAAPKEEQKYFLTTQQVDEARHAVFFHRFFDEVLDAGSTISESLASCQPDLNWGYRRTFDRLDLMADELRQDRSLPKFAQAVTLYHLIIEATLAQPGQHFIEDYTTRMDIMPGFREGMQNVSLDEQRHIGFGVKVLSELFAESDECKAAAAELLAEVMRYTISVFIPPEWDERWVSELGFSLEEIYAFGMKSFESKMRAAGLPLEELPPGVLPLDFSTPAEERARRSLAMAKAGLIADPSAVPDSSVEAQRLLFDAVERSVDHSAVNGKPITVQWRFEDAAPWHLHVDNGSSRASEGEAPNPDVTLETTWRQWVRLTMGGEDARKALLRRRLKARGSIRQLWRMPKVFPAPGAR